MGFEDFELREFDDERVAATKKSWLKVLDDSPSEFNKSSLERRLKLAETKQDYTDGSEFCYGIFQKRIKIASAILEISYTKQSSRWIKMLNLHLSPTLDLAIDQNAPNFQALANIFSVAIIGTLQLTGVHKSRVVKLYARTTVLLSFFEFIAAQLPKLIEQDPNGVDAGKVKLSVEGRWLVVKI